MANRACLHPVKHLCYIFSSIHKTSSRLKRNEAFQSLTFVLVRNSIYFLFSFLEFFLPGLCPSLLVWVLVPMKDLNLHGIFL